MEVPVQERRIRIYNMYCPPDRDLSPHTMDIPQENGTVVGDFSSRSQSWGYTEANKRGVEVEDWHIHNPLQLLNTPGDLSTNLLFTTLADDSNTRPSLRHQQPASKRRER